MKKSPLFASIATCFAASFAVAAPAAREVQILVKPSASASEAAIHALLSAGGGREHSAIDALNVRVIRVPEKAAAVLLEALGKSKDVEYAEADFTAQAVGTANDPYFSAGNQWALSKIEAPLAWDHSTGSRGVVVAVVDSGVWASHPDLAGKVLPGYDFINNDADATDDAGHGTAVAGVIGTSSNNGVGMASVAWENPILPVKVLGADGSGSYSAIANGIIWAANQGARVINLSLGGPSSSKALQDAVNYAWNRKCVLVAAAGNNGNNALFYPAACANVVAVAATNSADGRPSWSNFGSYVDVSAPGEGVLSLQGPNGYAYWSGTSFSSPVVSGVVGLMASVNGGLANASLVDLLVTQCDDIGTVGYDVYFGNGRVNANRAVTAAKASITQDTQAPVVSIGSPADAAVVSGSVNVGVSASDNVGVSRVEFYVGGTMVGGSNSASATFSWNTLTSVDGTYSLEARAYDAANNVGTRVISVSVRNSVVADTVAPQVAITSPGDGSTLGKTAKINVAASDNVRVTRVELYIDGALFGTSSVAPTSFSWNTAKAANGVHTLQAYAYDAAGNIGGSAILKVYK